MATRAKRNLNFLPAEPRAEPVIDISAYPVDIGVGELMRLTRERLGHELQSVANQLRIRPSYLEAIEDGRFRDLPGTTYAVGFVRSYADYLGLDGADIVRRFREEAARIHGQTKLVLPALSAEGKIPRAAVLLLSAVGLAVLYGLWYYRSSMEDTELPVIAEVPDRLVAAPPAEGPISGGDAGAGPPATPAPISSAAASPGVAPSPRPLAPQSAGVPAAPRPPVVPASPDTRTANDAAPAAAEPSPSATDPAATVRPGSAAAGADTAVAAPAPIEAPPEPVFAPSPEPAQSDVPASGIPAAPTLPASGSGTEESIEAAALPPRTGEGVVLEARLETWIKVVDAKGKTMTERVLKAGERYVVPNEPGLILRTGNAGGIDVLVNGRKAPPLGEVGAVYTRIKLDPNRLLDGTAVDG